MQKTGEVPASVNAEPRARPYSESPADLPMPMLAFRPDSEESDGEATYPVGKLHTARRVLARSSRLGAASRRGERLHAAAEAPDDDAGDGNGRVAEGSRPNRSGGNAAVKSDDDDLPDGPGAGANAHTALRGEGLSRERLGKTSRRRGRPSDGARAELEGESEDSAGAGDKSTDAEDGVDRDDAVGAADEEDDEVEARHGVGAKGNVRSADHDHADDNEEESDGDGSEKDSPAGYEGSLGLDTRDAGRGRRNTRRNTQRRSRGVDGFEGGDAETEEKESEGDSPSKRSKSDSGEDVPGAGSRDRRRSDPDARQRIRGLKPRDGVDDAEVGDSDTDLSATADQGAPGDRAQEQEQESRSRRGRRDRGAGEGVSERKGVDKMGADDDSGDREPAAGRGGRGRSKSLGARRGKGRDEVEAPMQETAEEDDGGMDEDDEKDSDTPDTPDISWARRKSSRGITFSFF